MKLLNLAMVIAFAAPLAVMTIPASAATAHNSQAGGFGSSKNNTDSTPASPRVKHAAKHHNHM